MKNRIFSFMGMPIAFLMGISMISCSNEVDILSEHESEGAVSHHVAENVSKEEAAKVAGMFNATRYGYTSGQTRSNDSLEVIKDEKGLPMAYIINSTDAGWVIVSATKAYFPILAWSDERDAEFTLADANEGVKMWMASLVADIKSSSELDSQQHSIIADEWTNYETNDKEVRSSLAIGGTDPDAVACRNRIKELTDTYNGDGWRFTVLSSVTNVTLPDYVYSTADQYGSKYQYTIVGLRDAGEYINIQPLISTQWHQGAGYNDLCPNGSPAGCVPIAMAQIMKFHKYPSYFDWDHMYDSAPSYATQYLIAHIGSTIGVKYGSDSSSASYNDAINGFNAYGYKTEAKSHNNADVIRELSTNRRPVYMRGQTSWLDLSAKGHAWVCDGVIRNISEYEYYVEYNLNGNYDNLGETLITVPGSVGGSSYTRFHMNWGWGKDYIGWYIGVNPTDEYNFYYDRKNIYIKLN